MTNHLFAGYSERSDDELLHLATQRHSLTTEAQAGLDTELCRRNLTESDQIEHQKFEKRYERREFRGRRRRKLFGKSQFSWRELLAAFASMAVIACAYILLPKRFHLNPDWEEPALSVMICSVLITVGWKSLWRDITFWISLILSSGIQLALAHALTRRTGELNRGTGRLAILVGFGLFIAIYACMRLLRRNFYGEGVFKPGS